MTQLLQVNETCSMYIIFVQYPLIIAFFRETPPFRKTKLPQYLSRLISSTTNILAGTIVNI